MAYPNLTFFCELESKPLQELIASLDLSQLTAMRASVSLGLVDLSQERAAVVRQLNAAGVPVIAWLLLPKEQGYWCNLDNAEQVVDRYTAFRRWSQENGLHFERIGLDIEPDYRLLKQLPEKRWKLLPAVLKRSFNQRRSKHARDIYCELVQCIRRDGYPVDSYQFPFIIDERQVRSSWLKQLACLVDIPADREVLMVYSSFLRPHGAGFVWSYAQDARSVGVGSTGGGVDLELVQTQPLAWQELARDLRMAWVHCNDIHIFSLEGCVQQGFLPRLVDFRWDAPLLDPVSSALAVERGRDALRTVLWIGSHPIPILAALFGVIFFWTKLGRWLKER